METRKIQTVGGGTYTVSLPKEWAESENCTAGTTVNLHTHIDGLLVIQTPESQTTARNRLRLEVGNDDPAEIEQLLRAAYAAGVESVVLEVPDGYSDEQHRAIERVTRNLTGVTVAEATESQVTVRTMLDAGEVSVSQSVRQLQFVALSMHRDAMAALTTGTTGDRWADRDEQADRLYAMIDRYFERGLARLDEIDALGLTRPELFTLWGTANELERVADHAERIGTVADRLDGQPDERIITALDSIAQDVHAVVEDAVRVIIGDACVDTARQTLATRRDVRERITSLDRQLFESGDADYRLTRALDSLARTAEHGGNIAEFGLRMAVRDGALSDPATDTDEANASSSTAETES
ncbi:transcriptional regulator [Haloarcula taiwanensis]|uniref:Transcriptional regulator n=1 Tax=Haloarcula taiwanensis TaxID=1932004 RepID=A0A2H5A0U1_9EURY|nr:MULTISPECIES: phosphate uptake regulator PhoU [Haloarcula]AUG48343.1 transcriptional regulator [Haloarcula taiwanensis]RLM39699.1 phosphate uptake regulator PhoU [Haloarcula sp. Atlit-120R]RLM47673.1 phosphate uptake regulator PhoU [Haloarcula sp. Atlit-47R]RLM97113.1 phosphate uptake regulator PhoU [Haloarcula sp. Atlit-7R]